MIDRWQFELGIRSGQGLVSLKDGGFDSRGQALDQAMKSLAAFWIGNTPRPQEAVSITIDLSPGEE